MPQLRKIEEIIDPASQPQTTSNDDRQISTSLFESGASGTVNQGIGTPDDTV